MDNYLPITSVKALKKAIRKDFVADNINIKKTKLKFQVVSEDMFTYGIYKEGENTLLDIEFSIIYNTKPFALFNKMTIYDLLENEEDIQYVRYTMRDLYDNIRSQHSYRLN